MQFDFGENWLSYSYNALTPERIASARKDFHELFSGIELKSKQFLDIGFGQGLSLLLAKEAGANVYGNDINPKCNEALKKTASLMNINDTIPIIVGSILDNITVQQLASPEKQQSKNELYDIVHSWGVLHHTGNMKLALKNALSLVKSDGYFVCAIYNKHITSKLWLFIKWLYCKSPVLMKKLLIVLMYPVIFIAKFFVTLKNPYSQMRGMDFYHNVVDWIGGYPYEYASQNDLICMVAQEGFTCIRTIPAQVPTGCNEFIFKKTA